MNTENLQRYLDSFGKQVLKDANGILSSQKGNTALSKSIRFKVEKDSQGFTTKFYMLDYGTFVDKGVKGADPSKVSKNAKITGQQAPSSPYSFKTKRPPSKFLEDWAKQKNFRLRDSKGKFTKGNYKTIGIILAKNVWARGIKPSLFFTKPLEIRYRELKTELLNVLKLDIEMYLTTYTK